MKESADELFTEPTPDEHLRFLVSFLFGGTAAPSLRDAVWRAYLDLSRTVHGIDAADLTGSIRRSAHDLVEHRLEVLLSSGPRDLEPFDAWHREGCNALREHFAKGGYPKFSIGQGQKWLNMAVKYSLTLSAVGWVPVRDSQKLRLIAHAPLDNFFLDGLATQPVAASMPRMMTTWSRLMDYDLYLEFQRALRNAFVAPPLDVEFHVWQRASNKRRALDAAL